MTTTTQAFINHLHRGGAWSFIWTPNAGATGDKKLSFWIPTGKPFAPPRSWETEHNLYFGVNPSTGRREDYQGSTNDTVAALNCLYAEFDGKDFTAPAPHEIAPHFAELRADPAKAKVQDDTLWKEATGRAKEAKYATDPTRYKALALAHVQTCKPSPSVIVDSGGGYQCYWLLRETFHIETDADRERAKDAQRRWVHYVGGDPGVNDLRRVLRLPGSRNYKRRYAPDFPLSFYVSINLDLQYDLAQLEALLPVKGDGSSPTPPPPTGGPRVERQKQEGNDAGASVIDAYNASVRIEDALTAAGYTRKGRRFIRPGGDAPSVTIFTDSNTSYHHNTSDPLYSEEHACSPFDVFCKYQHSGDVRSAVKAAAKLLGMEYKRATDEAPGDHGPLLAGGKLWIRTNSFAEFIPAELKGQHYRTDGTDTKVADAVLCLMEKLNRLTVRTGRRILGAAAGVGGATVQRSLTRLHGWLFDVQTTDEGIVITLRDDVRFAHLSHKNRADPMVAQVRETNEYSPHKADDAFLTGTSRQVKERCGEAAIVAGGSVKEWLETFPKGFGETALRVRDALARCGEMTAQELADETGKTKGAIWRACRRMEAEGLIESSREGPRAPKVYSPALDFWERVAEMTPTLRTYGLGLEREAKRLESAKRWTAKEQKKAREAGDQEAKARLDKRQKRLSNQQVEVLKKLHPEQPVELLIRMAHETPDYRHPAVASKVEELERQERRKEHEQLIATLREWRDQGITPERAAADLVYMGYGEVVGKDENRRRILTGAQRAAISEVWRWAQ